MPAPPLPPGLWARVAKRRQRQVATRRAGIALALALLAIGPLAITWRAQDARPRATSLPVAIAPPADAAPDLALSTIDHALQNAYARGASDDEIAPLWEARQRLLRPSPVTPDNS